MKLAAYRSPKQALPDLLNWAALIEADVILNKDGSLLAGFAYRGHDLGTASAAELFAGSLAAHGRAERGFQSG